MLRSLRSLAMTKVIAVLAHGCLLFLGPGLHHLAQSLDILGDRECCRAKERGADHPGHADDQDGQVQGVRRRSASQPRRQGRTKVLRKTQHGLGRAPDLGLGDIVEVATTLGEQPT